MPDTPNTGLPASAVNRLRHSGKAASPHPEANLLAAFSEQALAPPERDEVLTHLAQCVDCREIVALSLPPESEIVQPAAAEIRGWFGMRPEVMRWAVVGTSAAVVVAAVLLVKPDLEESGLRQTVNIEQPQGAAPAEIAKAQPPAAVPKTIAEKNGRPVKQPSADSTYVAGARPAETRGADSGKKDDGILGYALADSAKDAVVSPSTMAKQAAPAPPPPSGLTVDGARASGTAGGVGAGAGSGRGQAGALTSQVPAAPTAAKPIEPALVQAQSANSAQAEKEKTPARTAEAGAAASSQDFVVVEAQRSDETVSKLGARERKAMAIRPASNVAARTWRIASGRLQSSSNAGQSWQAVDLPSGVTALAVDAGYPLPSSVWAGAAAGVVLRSQDNGLTWSFVKAEWAGDVVAIKFLDARRGTLRTSTREEWVTEDGGLNWKKR